MGLWEQLLKYKHIKFYTSLYVISINILCRIIHFRRHMQFMLYDVTTTQLKSVTLISDKGVVIRITEPGSIYS